MTLEITERLGGPAEPQATLTLPYELRCKSRLRVRLDSGEQARLFLSRGTVLRQGDLLRADTGLVIRVEAAAEEVSTASTLDPLLLARACYHLGNRHVPLEIGRGWVRYPRDPVLDGLIQALGLRVTAESVPFEPEGGAYEGHGHHHAGPG